MRSNKPKRGGFRGNYTRASVGEQPDEEKVEQNDLPGDFDEEGEVVDFMNIEEQLEEAEEVDMQGLADQLAAGEVTDAEAVKMLEEGKEQPEDKKSPVKLTPQQEAAWDTSSRQDPPDPLSSKDVDSEGEGPLTPWEERLLYQLDAIPVKDMSTEDRKVLAKLKGRFSYLEKSDAQKERETKLESFEKMFSMLDKAFGELCFEEWIWSTLAETVEVREDPTAADLERALMQINQLINRISEEAVETHQKMDVWLDSLEDLSEAWMAVSAASSEKRALGEVKMRKPEWFKSASEARNLMQAQNQAIKRLSGQAYTLDGILKSRAASARADRLLGEVLDVEPRFDGVKEGDW